MILFFDHFMDTREKRYHIVILLLLLCCLLMFIPYIFLGYHLVGLQSYDDLFALLKTDVIQYTYISRLIADAISMTSFSFANLVSSFINNTGIVEILLLLFTLLCAQVLEKRRETTIILGLLVVEIFSACGLVIMSLQASTLGSVIQNIRYIGIVVLIINTMITIMVLYHLYHQIRYYYQSMQYRVIEEKEHTLSS